MTEPARTLDDTAAAPADAARPDRARRNFRLGVANGALYQAGEGFMDASTVVPVFLSRLTSSNALIGFATALPEMGWSLPQFLVVPWTARHTRQLPIYRRAASYRVLAIVLLAIAAWVLRDQPAWLLATFLVCYGGYCFGAGAGAVSFMDVVAKTVPRERLGAYFSRRLFWGGVCVVLVGLLVRQIMHVEDLGLRYALLFAAAGLLLSSAFAVFARVEEPPGSPAHAPRTAVAMLREGFTQLRSNPMFRRLLVARASLSTWLTAAPFMVLFAVHQLGGGDRVVGTFLFARVAGFVLANLWWPRLSRGRGNRYVMQMGALMIAGLTLTAACIAVASPFGLGWLAAGPAVLAFEALVFVGGAAHSGMAVAYASLLLEGTPPATRQSTVGLSNTFLGATMVLPAIGGALVDALNAPVVFALCSIGALFGWRAARRLEDSRGIVPEAPLQAPDVPGGGGGR